MGKYIGIFLGVTVFILCGFEPCVANMFYSSAANVWGGWALLYMLVMTLDNACGGVIIPLAVGCGQRNKTKCPSVISQRDIFVHWMSYRESSTSQV